MPVTLPLASVHHLPLLSFLNQKHKINATAISAKPRKK
jgi:hypothetical protein